MQRVFLTGGRGFVGAHLGALLRDEGVDVVCSDADVRDADALRAELSSTHPDAVVHLAAISSVAQAWGAELEVFNVNAAGSLALALAVRDAAPDARILLASSGEVYGRVPEERQPITESEPVAPLSPYGVSKAAAELSVRQAARDVIVCRAFNHLGAGQDERFAVASFAAQIAAIERGEREPVLHVGNLDARRDFSDVRDVVRAYWLALQQAEAGTYNVASGRAVPLREVLDRLLAAASVEIAVERDQARMRPSDLPLLCGDATRLREATGWSPAFSLDETLAEVLSSSRSEGVRS